MTKLGLEAALLKSQLGDIAHLPRSVRVIQSSGGKDLMSSGCLLLVPKGQWGPELRAQNAACPLAPHRPWLSGGHGAKGRVCIGEMSRWHSGSWLCCSALSACPAGRLGSP